MERCAFGKFDFGREAAAELTFMPTAAVLISESYF